MNREELDAEIKMVDLTEALDAAKEKAFASGDEADLDALKEAEMALAKHRVDTHPGTVRATSDADGAASPDPVAVSTEGG